MSTDGWSNSILVTGADRGLGLGFVRHYVKKGKSVVATSRRSHAADELAGLAKQYPGRMQVMSLDVSDGKSISEFAGIVKARNIAFEIVISNAGVTIEEPFGQWTAETFGTNFLVNTVGPALIFQAIEPFLEQGAKVVHVSSGMGSIEWNINPENSLDAYAVSKCGLNILSRRLAEKLRPGGITVFLINPGWVKTDMGGLEAPTTVDEAIDEMTSTIARVTIDDTGSFLASDGSVIPW